jgi:hypothetical protein
MKIILENGTEIHLEGKSLLILSASSQTDTIINQEGDYDVIYIDAGIDRTINIELRQPAIILVNAGIRNTINVTGGMAIPISQVILIGGTSQNINGLINQYRGRLISNNGETLDLSVITCFSNIKISK